MQEILEKAAAIRLVLFDVDGVLTDGSLYLGAEGLELKAFNSRDGHGMRLLLRGGVEIGVITGRQSQLVSERMQSLGIRHLYQGQENKLEAFQELLDKLRLTPAQVAYVGDDIVDLAVMRRVGLAIAVADADPMVRRHAHWQTRTPGGRGAAREVCELVLQAQGKLQALLQGYL